jgi:hypothetical protein
MIRLVSILLPIVLLAGCATAIRGPNVEFIVLTEPEGAIVTTTLETRDSRRARAAFDREQRSGSLDGAGEGPQPVFHSCEATPCHFDLSRRAEFEVHVTMPGYHPATISITSGFGGGTTQAIGGGALVATGAYLVSYSVFSAATTVATLGLAGSSYVGSVAGSAAASAATGVGVLMLGVDLASGAMLDLRPNPLVLVLIPIDQPLPQPGDAFIATPEALEDLLEDLRSEGAADDDEGVGAP